jgi:hypothetical protein
MTIRTTALLPLLIVTALLITGCAGEAPKPTETESAGETATPSPTPTADVVDSVFAMPADCVSMLPDSRVQAFAARNMVLLGGPGGLYANYYVDPTPPVRAGGISCVWGDELVPENTVEISVAPLSAATRGPIVDDLIAQGLNEAPLDDGISYAQLGDETSAPAVLNIIRDDSWISILEARGGEQLFGEATEIAAEVAEIIYVAP